MPILNYTTKVPVEKTLSEIQKSLVKGGAQAILNQYDNNGLIVSVNFQITVNGSSVGFRLPCNWKPVLEVMRSQKVSRSLCTQEQAMRVAWRIVKDWIEAQMALVSTQMVKTEQVFLPYAVNKNGLTVYENFAENPQLLLT